jgi:hypothetical protein
MTRPSTCDFYTASTISLNNIAVSLVERRCYQEALETFYDSLQVFFANPSQHDQRNLFVGHITETPTPAEVEHKLYRASLHLSCEVESDHPPALVALEEEDESSALQGEKDTAIAELEQRELSIPIRNQYGQDTSFDRSKGLVGESLEFFVYFQQQPHCGVMKDTTSTLLTTILHNKGQTCRCLSQLSRSSAPHWSERLLDQSEKLFFLSRQKAQLATPNETKHSCSLFTSNTVPAVPSKTTSKALHSDHRVRMHLPVSRAQRCNAAA